MAQPSGTPGSSTGRQLLVGFAIAAVVVVVGGVLVVGAVVALLVHGQRDTATKESVQAYQAVTEDPLWHVVPKGFDASIADESERRASCSIKPDAVSDREAGTPQRLLDGPHTDDLELLAREIIAKAEHAGWRVTEQPHDPQLIGATEDEQRVDFTVAKVIAGHRTNVQVWMLSTPREASIELIPEVEGVHVCPPGSAD